jgi:hypothetical protein
VLIRIIKGYRSLEQKFIYAEAAYLRARNSQEMTNSLWSYPERGKERRDPRREIPLLRLCEYCMPTPLGCSMVSKCLLLFGAT